MAQLVRPVILLLWCLTISIPGETNARDLTLDVYKIAGVRHLVKRDDPIDGGVTDISVDDPAVKDLEGFVLEEIEKTSDSSSKLKLVNVLHATSQVVAGMKYVITVEVGETTCLKGSDEAADSCPLKDDSNNQICNVSVWVQSWLNKKEVLDISCTPALASRSQLDDPIAGGVTDISVDDPAVKDLEGFVLEEIEKNYSFKLKLVNVLHATSQVVSGMKYVITVEVGETTCLKGSDEPADSCPLKDDSNNQICNVSVLAQAWLNKKEVTYISCTPTPAARSQLDDPVPGGVVVIGVDDPIVKDLESFVLEAIDQRTNCICRKKIIEVLNATAQVVAGLSVTLTVEVGDTTCRKGGDENINDCPLEENSQNQICHVTVLELSWPDNREVTALECNNVQENGEKAE